MAKRSKDYWKERFEILEEQAHKQGVEYYDHVSRQYEAAIRNVEKEISAWYTRYATENQVSLTEAKRLLNGRELEAFRMDVKEYIEKGASLDPQWRKQLEQASAKFHVSRLEALKVRMQQNVEFVSANTRDAIDDMAHKVYSDQYYKTLFEFQKGVGVGFDVAELNEKKINKVLSKPWAADGRNFSSRIWGDRTKLVNELNNRFTQGVIRGENPQKIIRDISKKFNVSRANAKRLVMTENKFFQSQAQLDGFKELGVEEYEISATLDSKTSEICQDMDGEHFKLSEFEVGVTASPFHPHCRTTQVPYDPEGDSFFNFERAAKDEEGKYYTVPADMKYKDWKGAFVGGGDKSGLPVKPKFEAVKSISEAEAVIRSLGVPNVSYKGIDLNVANEMNQSLVEHFNDFPELKNNIQFFGSAQEKKKFLEDAVRKYYKELYANYISVYGEKTINKKIDSLVNRYFRTRGEYAHAFDHREYFNNKVFSGLAINKKFGGNVSAFMQALERDVKSKFHPVGCDTVKSVFDHEFGHQLDYLLKVSDSDEFIQLTRGKVSGDSLSRYALKNRKETLAEAWAEYRNNPEPRPIAKAIGELIESKYKARFKK